MRPSLSLLLQSLALRLAVVNGQALATVTYGPGGPCSAPLVTSVIVQPVYYSSFFQSASQIVNIFGNGETITIGNAPTTYIQNTYITTTIVSTVTTMINPSSLSSSVSGTSSTTTSGSDIGPVTTSALSSSSGSTSLSSITPTPSSITTTMSGYPTAPPTIYSTVAPPITIPTPQPVLLSTSVDSQGNTVTVTVTQPTFTLGEGLQSGVQTKIPATSPVLVGIAFGGPGAKVKRQAPTAAPSSTLDGPQPAGLLQGDDGGSGNNCGFATRWYLSEGMLLAGNDSVGRNFSDFYARITPQPWVNDVDTTFYFNDGILGWNSSDQGPATFYQCGDSLVYAGFPYPPREDCYVVTLGGIAAAACPVDYTDSAVETSTTTTSDSPESTTTLSVPDTTTTSDITTTSDMPSSALTTTAGVSSVDSTTTSPIAPPTSSPTPTSSPVPASTSSSPSLVPTSSTTTHTSTAASVLTTASTSNTAASPVSTSPTSLVLPTTSTTSIAGASVVTSTSSTTSTLQSTSASTSRVSSTSTGGTSETSSSSVVVGTTSTTSSSGSQTSPASSSSSGTSNGPAGVSSTTSVVGQSTSSTTQGLTSSVSTTSAGMWFDNEYRIIHVSGGNYIVDDNLNIELLVVGAGGRVFEQLHYDHDAIHNNVSKCVFVLHYWLIN
ncbi:hypothetical protein A1O1_03142 [Capronia coronata CBS 617.96]|uniref:DUF7908 domain-containing protein n=1 Tax=Capronia coronata CBS 617.96 TaxID=1182541 RepID=W9YYH0_9EURO|nr:uncharacterized protein A1O1_03142 [Capronia coronata CBS 617.96]EXJ94745.1 hypothetical protein A1O1_03142 [Capronia coronata CBS 617.96]